MWYVLFFHLVAIVDAIITACIFSSESVGASAGIFAVIGVLGILLYRKFSDTFNCISYRANGGIVNEEKMLNSGFQDDNI